jgi:5,10-methylenetetrahydrofolate reductase
MQTLTLDIQDNFMQDFQNIIEKYKDKITIKKDINLEYDPYFYERKKDLEQIIEDCENGDMELLSQEQYDTEMDVFFKDLKANANI